MSGKKKTKKQKKSFLESLKSIVTSTTFLGIVFVLLLGLVIILGIYVHDKKNEEREELHANIMIPINEVETEYEFSISAIDLRKVGKYIFKITNYLKDAINEDEIVYSITIQNPTDSVITLTKEDAKENLMLDQKKTVIENEILPSLYKKDVYYTVQFAEIGDLKNKDLISIIINS
jgi:hypothetical protein